MAQIRYESNLHRKMKWDKNPFKKTKSTWWRSFFPSLLHRLHECSGQFWVIDTFIYHAVIGMPSIPMHSVDVGGENGEHRLAAGSVDETSFGEKTTF